MPFTFRPIPANIRSLARTKRVHDLLVWRADRVVKAAGAGHERQEYLGRVRWRMTIQPTTARARRDAGTRLLAALSAGRIQGRNEESAAD